VFRPVLVDEPAAVAGSATSATTGVNASPQRVTDLVEMRLGARDPDDVRAGRRQNAAAMARQNPRLAPVTIAVVPTEAVGWLVHDYARFLKFSMSALIQRYIAAP